MSTVSTRHSILSRRLLPQQTVYLIRKKVHCFDDNNAYLKAYQDYANLIGEKSKCNGFEESWSKMQTKLQEHFDLWKKCPDEKSDLSIIT